MTKRWLVSYLPKDSQYDATIEHDTAEEAVEAAQLLADTYSHNGTATIYEQVRQEVGWRSWVTTLVTTIKASPPDAKESD